MKYSIDVNYMKLIDGIVEFNHGIDGFCLLDLSSSEREVLKSSTTLVDSSISP